MTEIIRWPLRIWIVIFALNLSIVLAIGVALSDLMIVSLFLGLTILTIYSSVKTTLKIQVTESLFKVKGAQIERKFIDRIELLDEAQMRNERSYLLNPKAFLALRFWVKTGVKIYLSDDRDPTPYWLISSRKGNLIKDTLRI
ncbi:MAG: DUF3093 domain-containing protein [Candidatus Nanopelagicaceae bacterium]